MIYSGPHLEQIGESLLRDLDAKNRAREKALTDSRATIRNCAQSVRATHRAEFDRAAELLAQAATQVAATRAELAQTPDVYWAGYVQDAQKEFAEASIILAVVAGRALPEPAGLGVEAAPYLNGLGEAAGEMRRYVLDIIRHGEMARGEQVLRIMEDIYSLLVTIDYPDAVTNGLRRTTDLVRGVLERTRGDLTFAIQQQILTAALAQHLPAGTPIPPARYALAGEDETEA
ncbi:MAG TPA: haloacid dehalogenase [Chloroflexia bacterium]|nr:haloacid dehalogenase [Chloroflexia bacterium]